MFYTVKTVVGRENIVLDTVSTKAKSEKLQVKSLLHPEEIRGYVFIEGELTDVEKAVQMVPHVRGLIKSPVEFSQIQKFLQPKKIEVELNVGDIVEVIGGPFKGEKGKVTRFDKVKRECTIELIEATVPIPITISAELVKVTEKKV